MVKATTSVQSARWLKRSCTFAQQVSSPCESVVGMWTDIVAAAALQHVAAFEPPMARLKGLGMTHSCLADDECERGRPEAPAPSALVGARDPA